MCFTRADLHQEPGYITFFSSFALHEKNQNQNYSACNSWKNGIILEIDLSLVLYVSETRLDSLYCSNAAQYLQYLTRARCPNVDKKSEDKKSERRGIFCVFSDRAVESKNIPGHTDN